MSIISAIINYHTWLKHLSKLSDEVFYDASALIVNNRNARDPINIARYKIKCKREISIFPNIR